MVHRDINMTTIITPYGHYVEAEIYLDNITARISESRRPTSVADRELLEDLLIAGMTSLKDENVNHFNEWLLKH